MATYSDLSGALLVLRIDDLAMIKDHSPTTVAVTHARLPAVLLGKKGLGVAQEENFVALDAIDLTPGIHNPGIVARDSGNDINALLAELLDVLDVRR